MVIFHSYISHYQRLPPSWNCIHPHPLFAQAAFTGSSFSMGCSGFRTEKRTSMNWFLGCRKCWDCRVPYRRKRNASFLFPSIVHKIRGIICQHRYMMIQIDSDLKKVLPNLKWHYGNIMIRFPLTRFAQWRKERGSGLHAILAQAAVGPGAEASGDRGGLWGDGRDMMGIW